MKKKTMATVNLSPAEIEEIYEALFFWLMNMTKGRDDFGCINDAVKECRRVNNVALLTDRFLDLSVSYPDRKRVSR